MSTATNQADSGRTPWENLSHHRQRLLKAIAEVHGRGKFERPDLQADIEASSTVSDIVDSQAKVVKSLNSTTLLNGLVRDGYLDKTHQGGESPIVLYLEYDDSHDNYEVAPFGNLSKFHDLVFQILDSHELSETALGEVDMTDFNAVVDAVNRAVGHTVLVIVSETSEYKWTDDEAYETAFEHATAVREDN